MLERSIPLFKVAMSETAPDQVASVLASGMIGEGPRVEQFQRELSMLFEHEHVVPVSSCTASLALAMRLAGVGPGNEVISSPFTMVATSSAIKQAGGVIKWCDIEATTLCADISDIKRIMRPGRTKAIVITCVGGLVPHRLDELANCGVPVILDCAHGLTTRFQERHISHWADYCCFSFQSIKPLTTGDGGALTTRHRRDWERAEKLKWFGLTRHVPEGMTRLQHQMTADVAEWGYKYHLNDIAAAIGLSNVELALRNIEAMRSNSREYLRELAAVDGLTTLDPPGGCLPDWWVFGLLARNRNELVEHLEQSAIAASPMWARNDRYTAFMEGQARPLPGVDRVMNEAVFIPNGWWLTAEDRHRIVSAIRRFY